VSSNAGKFFNFMIEVAVMYWVATAVVAGTSFFAVIGYALLGLLVLGIVVVMVTE
jgi:hypothetical protein